MTDGRSFRALIIKALLAKKWISESQGAITYNF